MNLRKLLFSLLLGYAIIAIFYGQDPADSARYLYIEYLQAREAGDFSGSEILLERILEGEYSVTEYNLALVHNALGYVYYETGRFKEALEQYRIAEGLVSGTDPSTLQLRISIHINQALYHKDLGDYTNALQYNNKALRLLDLVPAWDDLSFRKLSALLLNKGITLYQLERYEKALGILKECEQIKESHNHPYLGSVYFNLARVYQRLGDPELTHSYYLKGINRWISEYDPNYYELANIYLHFGQFLTVQGENEEGFEYLQKALKNYTRNYGPIHPLTAACYENLARHSLDQSRLEQAMEYLQLALHSISEDFEGKDHFSNPEIETSSHGLTLLRILATKANALERASDNLTIAGEKIEFLKAALATNILSIDLLHQIQGSFLSGESRIYMTSRQKDLFTTGIRLNLDMFKITGREVYKEEAFLMAAKGKSSELMFEMNNKEWLYLESLSDTGAITATELKQQIDHFSNLIQTETMDLNPDSAQLVTWQEQLFHTRDSFNRQMEQLRYDFPQIGHFESTNIDFSIDQIRRNLNRNETLVEYFLTGAESTETEQLFIFVVSKNECHFYQSPIDTVFYHNLETITHNLHGFIPYRETVERFDSLKVALFGVYQEFVQPVESLFGGRNLVIVPDEMLSYIPFDALITHLEPDSITNYAGISYLLHDYNISYMYNSQLIKRKRSRVWGFPGVTAWIPEHTTAPVHGFGKLKGAVEEVQDILKVVKGHSIQKSLEKSEVISLLQENSILHLAMHSLATENSGKSPYFILDTITDPLLANRMHDYEINALNLSTPMVVLSSCETAGGQLRSGEGIMSLSRSFLQAGATSVVHSLWPVEDAISREIMVGFYREIKQGHSKSSALSNVKRQYLESHPPFYTHPYYWAAFQITGDTSPLHSKWRGSYTIGSILIVFLIFYYLKRRSLFRRV
ncbi:MAG: CHAT domain-containing protein [Bacteroidales bacterium]|nr:CHAT domain-containing protein [Bacteroidales bacterium]